MSTLRPSAAAPPVSSAAAGLRPFARDPAAAERAGYTEEGLEKLFLQLT
jgi:hypothetical protein